MVDDKVLNQQHINSSINSNLWTKRVFSQLNMPIDQTLKRIAGRGVVAENGTYINAVMVRLVITSSYESLQGGFLVRGSKTVHLNIDKCTCDLLKFTGICI